jgi:O-antigen ligase
MSLIGLLQYLGVHILFSEWFKPFITSRELTNTSIEGLYSIDYKVILQTLSHYNYVGYFITLSLPVTIALLIYEHNRKMKVLYGLLSVLILFNLFGSTARGGLLGIMVSIPFLLFINRHKLIKNRKVAITLILMFTVVFVGFEIISGGFVTMRLKSTFTSIDTANILQDVIVEEDTMRFNITDKQFEIKVVSAVDAEWDVQFKLDDVIIKPAGLDENGALYFDPTVLPNVKNYITSAEDQFLYTVDIYGTPWYFGYFDDKLSYINVYGKSDSIIKPDSIGFEGKEKFGSARGYIWSRSLPLILKKPLLGYGPDTFALAFPQSDYVGKYNAYNTTNMVVDKAHNTFIQIAINSGIVALLAYIVLHIILAVRMIRYFIKNKFNATSIYHSIFSSVALGYFIASFFNDSTVQVSPTYWGLLGLSFIIFESNESEIDFKAHS